MVEPKLFSVSRAYNPHQYGMQPTKLDFFDPGAAFSILCPGQLAYIKSKGGAASAKITDVHVGEMVAAGIAAMGVLL
jgi:hypothetical protein